LHAVTMHSETTITAILSNRCIVASLPGILFVAFF
jgi:hypothetical protein